jgi:hypothetical protein
MILTESISTLCPTHFDKTPQEIFNLGVRGQAKTGFGWNGVPKGNLTFILILKKNPGYQLINERN